jgi:3-hydroxyacyl-CoA dehydrogenase / enoyl-CoA hydratase / 3-hydroxybutyryl-CoA epimerase
MSTSPAWKFETDAENIGYLTLDKPDSSANTLSQSVLRELQQQLRTLGGGGSAARLRGLIIKSGKPSGFIAGADIREFTTFSSAADALAHIELGQQVCSALEALPFPTVAAIHGFALGGGLELALACRYRVAVGDARLALGLPEVQLGIHPGFGGTVRSVRLLGVRPAMNLMLTGRPVRADRVRQIGLVDRLVDTREALDVAARELIALAPPVHRPPLSERMLSWPLVRPLIRPALLRKVAAQARRDHYPAPYAIVDLWSRHGARGAAAYAAEAHSIASLFQHDSTRNLIRVFLLQDRLKAMAGKPAGSAPAAPMAPAGHAGPALSQVHVVGAGVMGGDIAAWCALRGLSVTLQDRELRLIEPALERARALFEKRLTTPAERASALQRLRADPQGAGIAAADVLIEAVFEDLDTKRALFAAAEPQLHADAVLASNTSSLTLESLAGSLRDPGRLVGLHFFNPVPQMPLVEVVHFPGTRPATLAAAIHFTRRIDKLPLPCRSSPGFLVNRVLFPYLHEALRAAGEGVGIETIDRAAVDFGMPMGPLQLCDVVGLDVLLHVGEIVTRELKQEPPAFIATVRRMVEQRHLGRKSGRGFYVWHDGKAVGAVTLEHPTDAASTPSSGGDGPPGDGTRGEGDRGEGNRGADLADRLILALVNECVACLREGIVEDADLVDAGVIFGSGFAPFRGGPLNYARARGVAACVQRLQQLAARYGARFTPDAGWQRLESAR